MNELKNLVSGDGNILGQYLKDNNTQGAVSLASTLVSVLNNMDQDSQNNAHTGGTGNKNEAAQQVICLNFIWCWKLAHARCNCIGYFDCNRKLSLQ